MDLKKTPLQTGSGGEHQTHHLDWTPILMVFNAIVAMLAGFHYIASFPILCCIILVSVTLMVLLCMRDTPLYWPASTRHAETSLPCAPADSSTAQAPLTPESKLGAINAEIFTCVETINRNHHLVDDTMERINQGHFYLGELRRQRRLVLEEIEKNPDAIDGVVNKLIDECQDDVQ